MLAVYRFAAVHHGPRDWFGLVQVPPHTDPLASLAGVREGDLLHRAHRGSRGAVRQRGQLVTQRHRVAEGNGCTVREVAAARTGGPYQVGHGGLRSRWVLKPGRVAPREFAEGGITLGGQRQHSRRAAAESQFRHIEVRERLRRRNRDTPGRTRRPAPGRVRLGPRMRVALKYEVSVRARHAVRAHCCERQAARVVRPRGGLGGHPHGLPVPVELGCRGLEMQVTGNHPVVHRQHRLDEASHSGRRFQVTKVGLGGADQQRVVRVPSLGVHRGRGGQLDRVADSRSCTVRLHVVHCGRINARPAQGFPEDLPLSEVVRRRIGRPGAVVIDGRAAKHAPDAVPIGNRVAEPLQHDDAAALAANPSVR